MLKVLYAEFGAEFPFSKIANLISLNWLKQFNLFIGGFYNYLSHI